MEPKSSLYLADLLKLNNIDPKKVMLIRHSKSDKEFKKCLDKDFIKEYTCIQKQGFAVGYRYWMVFISDFGTKAKYLCTYKICGRKQIDKTLMPKKFPVPSMYNNSDTYAFFELEETDILNDMKNRLTIEWGKGTLSWAQKAENDKPVISIHSAEFSGYDNVILSFKELSDIVKDQSFYSDYVSALKGVKAVYLICDKATGKQYVGSATGNDGLFGRWTDYVITKHGNNKKIIEYLKNEPNGYENFQFSILQIFSMKALKKEVIAAEKLYKEKLMSIKNGWNDN